MPDPYGAPGCLPGPRPIPVCWGEACLAPTTGYGRVSRPCGRHPWRVGCHVASRSWFDGAHHERGKHPFALSLVEGRRWRFSLLCVC